MANNRSIGGVQSQFSSTNQPSKRSGGGQPIAALRKTSAKELAELCEMILHASKAELAAVLSDPNTSMITVNLISAILADTQKGLTYTLDKLLERVYGRPKTQIELSSDPDNPMNFSPVQILVSLPENGRGKKDE